MFSVITNIYNKKAKGPTLKELFTATGKLKKCLFFLTTRDVRCVHHGSHGTHRYDISNISSCQKKKFSFPVAVNSSIKVGPLAFLL